MSAFQDFFIRFKNEKRQFYKASLFSVVNKVFDLAPEVLIGMAIDVVVNKEDSFLADWGLQTPGTQILLLAFLTFFIWAGESLFEYLLLTHWKNLAQNIQHNLRTQGYQKLQGLPLLTLSNHSTGDLTATLNDDVNQLERFLNNGVNQLIQTFVAVLGVGFIFLYISPLIAVCAFTPIPIIVFGAFYFQKKAAPLYSNVRETAGSLADRLTGNIGGIATIKSFRAESRQLEIIKFRSSLYQEANRKAIRLSSSFIPIIRMAILFGFFGDICPRRVFDPKRKPPRWILWSLSFSHSKTFVALNSFG